MNETWTMRESKSVGFLIWLGMMMLAGIVFRSECRAEVSKLSEEDTKVLRQVENFHEIRTVTNLPPEILKLCVDFKGRLANPGKKWEATDDIDDRTLPTHRLIWAVKGGEYYVVHYEVGGLGYNCHVLVAVMGKQDVKPRVALDSVGFKKFKNYEKFVESLGRKDVK
jgi:hypothetical protein